MTNRLSESFIQAFGKKASKLNESHREEKTTVEIIEAKLSHANAKLSAARMGGVGNVGKLAEEKIRLERELEEAKGSRKNDSPVGDVKPEDVEDHVKTPQHDGSKTQAPKRKADRSVSEERSTRTDPVDKTEIGDKFKDRDDKDIDNDGDVDSSDEYLHKRRKAIAKAMKKKNTNEETDLEEGIQDKKAIAAMKAIVDGMPKKKAIVKYGVSPKKLDQAIANVMKESVDLDEKTVMQGSKEHLDELIDQLEKAKPGSTDHSQIRQAIEAMFGKDKIPKKHRNVRPVRENTNKIQEEKTIKISFHDAAAKKKWMKKQSISPKEIIDQSSTHVEVPASMKQYADADKHDEIYQVRESAKPDRLQENYAIYHKGKIFDTFDSKEEAQDAMNGMDLSSEEKKDYKIRKVRGSSSPKMTGKMTKESVELDEAVDPRNYKASSEKSQFGGYSALITNKKTGKVMYSGQARYKTPELAKGEAEAYLKGYSEIGDRTADRYVRNYVKKHKSDLAESRNLRKMQDKLSRIAQKYLHIDTLKTRNSDSLDFHDLSVWQIEDALRAAYKAGQSSVNQSSSTNTRKMQSKLLQIAQKHLNLTTLKTRNSDSLDFHDVAVWQIEKALEAAYAAGQRGLDESVNLSESKMSDSEVLKAAKALASNGKDKKTKEFGKGLVDYYKENNSFTPDQVAGLQNIMKNAPFQMAK